MMNAFHRFSAVGLVLFALTTVTAADDWPQFRGPDGQGHSAATDLPVRWSETENVAWKTQIEGRGWSSPVIVNEQIWLTTAIETAATEADLTRALEQNSVVVPKPYLARRVTLKAICIDCRTGQIVHNVTLFEVDRPVLLNATNSYASPTPVAADGRIYCDFGAMGTICLDATTARPVWSKHFVIEHQVGPGSSPIVFKNLLILLRDGCDQQYVMALDAATGAVVWKTSRPPLDTPTSVYRKAFSTPLVIEDNGKTQLIAPGAQWIVSYDPETGRELWRVDTGATFSNTSRPVYADGMVYVCTAFGGTKLWAIRANGRGDVTSTHVAWEMSRGTPRRSSPLLWQNRLYLVSDRGVASCLDVEAGNAIWSERLSGAHSASPVLADGRLYFFSETGTSSVISPADAFQLLASNHLDGHIMATPAISDHAIFLRTDTHLYRIQKSGYKAD